MQELLEKKSIFITNDTRKKLWAVPYHHEAVNTRAELLLKNNIKHIKNKTILDLGCHFGTFAYVALKLGAKKVIGIDVDSNLISQANKHFKYYNVDQSRYEFINEDALSYLEELSKNSFDTIFCLGLLYYIPDNYYFLKQLSKIARESIVLDTFTAYYIAIQGKNYEENMSKVNEDTFTMPLMFYNYTQSKKKYYQMPHQTTNKKDKQLSLINCPTKKLLEMYFSTLNFDATELIWDKHLKNPEKLWKQLFPPQGKIDSHWTDIYSTGIRVSYLLKPT